MQPEILYPRRSRFAPKYLLNDNNNKIYKKFKDTQYISMPAYLVKVLFALLGTRTK